MSLLLIKRILSKLVILRTLCFSKETFSFRKATSSKFCRLKLEMAKFQANLLILMMHFWRELLFVQLQNYKKIPHTHMHREVCLHIEMALNWMGMAKPANAVFLNCMLLLINLILWTSNQIINLKIQNVTSLKPY